MGDDGGLGEEDAATRDFELEFLRKQEVYRQILDAIADMVLVKGKHSRILWANKAFRDYYRMSNEQLREIVDAPFNKVDYTQQYVSDDFKVYSTGETLEIADEPVTRHDGLVQAFSTVKSAMTFMSPSFVSTESGDQCGAGGQRRRVVARASKLPLRPRPSVSLSAQPIYWQ